MSFNEMKSANNQIDKDLSFTDSSVQNEAKRVKELSFTIDYYLKEYLCTLESLKESGIMAGKTEKALESFISSSKNLIGGISNIGEYLSNKTEGFLVSIDKADGYLY